MKIVNFSLLKSSEEEEEEEEENPIMPVAVRKKSTGGSHPAFN